MQAYIERFITAKIRQKLEKVPGVVILGPRQCGKSTLAKAIISDIESAIYLDLERPSDVNKLRDPEAFFSIMQYVTSLGGPDSPYLPTRWMTETLWSYLSGSRTEIHLFNAALLWSTAGALFFTNLWIAEATYFVGFSRSQRLSGGGPEGKSWKVWRHS